MKRILGVVFILLCLLPIKIFANEKVKVYVFEAGGCPACEAQLEYLESLDSYNKTFTIIRKELYVDHVDWEKGADYDLGVKVAQYFNKHGFRDAGYTSTPLVVVSDIYAKNGYNSALESVIADAYSKGDNDIVSKIANGEIVEEKENHVGVLIAIGVILVGGVAALIAVANHDTKNK